MPHPTLGVALITKNAEARLAQCLAALSFADEVVIVDSGSSDSTLDIARAHGTRIQETADWPGFGLQKNRAIDLVDCDWVLVIDADEVVTTELAASIRQAIASGHHDVWQLNRLSSFCGQWMRHSGWFPDWIPRLFRKGAARYSDELVHEHLVYAGNAGRLDGLLHHYSYERIEDVLRKLDSYSSAGAAQRAARGETASMAKALGRGLWAFIRTYVFKRGFLDGAAGLQVAIFNAETVYYRFLKLALLNRRDGKR
ncbi:glycosyltransferase family 2 protein [Chitinolyticbacter meiyuanensis]|uniref:glycosyltransferase family 2 protein n=1 Tax=Chitinolyticbacter meiyuanensis TaxID=682798 RepID=UPI0011E5DF8E|nr:glycosyltransferase family 2 protein [Chitinolyticbacter meiyuanensis]